jgi:hypothetical protein
VSVDAVVVSVVDPVVFSVVVSGVQVGVPMIGVTQRVVTVDLAVVVVAFCTWVESEPVPVLVVVVVLTVVASAAGLRSSATSPARRTVAAKAPRRAALIQVTSAERV